MTHALLSGSPAIEKDASGGVLTDQRGLARPVDSTVLANATGGDGGDIGACEMQADILPGCNSINRIVQNGNDSGTDSLRDVLSKVCAGSTITFAAGVTSVNLTTAELTINKSVNVSGPGANLLSVQRTIGTAMPQFRIFNVAGNFIVTISGLTIANGYSPGQPGAGIRNGGTLNLNGVAVTGNNSFGGDGGGIYSSGNLNIASSTISGNTASSIGSAFGGGIANNGGAVTVANSTISGNSAATLGTGNGGGIWSNVGTVLLVNSTITSDSSDFGGGVRGANGAVVTARNTIIALNTGSVNGPNAFGPVTSQGFNLVGDKTGMSVSPALLSDHLGLTPVQVNLGALNYNGGPTRTRALLASSFALDKGHSSGYATDQRGRFRPIDLPAATNATGGDGSDIGAFEFSVLSLDIDGNGTYDPYTDGQLITRYLFGLTGTALTGGAIGSAPVRFTPQDILAYLDSIRSAMDVDGNSSTDALTDGLILVRYMSGLRGPALISGALGGGTTRTRPQIEAYILTLTP